MTVIDGTPWATAHRAAFATFRQAVIPLAAMLRSIPRPDTPDCYCELLRLFNAVLTDLRQLDLTPLTTVGQTVDAECAAVAREGNSENAAPRFDSQAGTLWLGTEQYSLEASEVEVLKALVERGAATLSMLRNASTTDSPHKILRKLVRKYPVLDGFITFPGVRGKGGYSTKIAPTGGCHSLPTF
jgi:hypothetical protein